MAELMSFSGYFNLRNISFKFLHSFERESCVDEMLMWFADSLAISEQKLTNNCCHSLQARRSMIISDLQNIKLPPLTSNVWFMNLSVINLCDANYIGYTSRHLHQRVEEHKLSAIGKHYKDEHDIKPVDLIKYFKVLKKCRGKLECLIYERTKDLALKRNRTPSVRNYLHKYFHFTLYNLFLTSLFLYVHLTVILISFI